ncbi:Hypothetical predicted protein [Paramuricea clavata]|uniref:Uncharacterized protein n=1 Tax=Paramuricea clavata TaxID=317549 RepID=A0A7D9I0E8_PARCT|nr:Hypothetical predicted protein [Paramuricea clavata]
MLQDDEPTQKKNLELLRYAKKGSMSAKTYVGLVEDTFNYRRTFVQTLVSSVTEVLQMCPYLAKKEVFRILGWEGKVKDHMNDAKTSLKQAFNIAMDNATDYDMTSEELIKAVELMEKKKQK